MIQVPAVFAATVSRQRLHLGLLFDLLDLNVSTEDFEPLIERLLRAIRRPITVVFDRLWAHKSAAKRLLIEHPARLAFEWFPSYSPDPIPLSRSGVIRSTAALPTSFPTIFVILAGPSPTFSGRRGVSSDCSAPPSFTRPDSP